MPIINIENDKQWRDMRLNHIGASEIAALFNESPHTTVNELFHIKRGNLTGVEDSVLMAFGRLMEPVIAALVTEHYQWEMIKCKQYHSHPEYPWLGCSLDYYCIHPEFGEGIVQIKNVQNFAPGWTKETAPNHVELQVQHELFVTNAARQEMGLKPFTWCAIASMHAGNPEDIRVMFRAQDQKMVHHIVKRSSLFWSDLQKNVEPPLVGAQDYDHVVDLFKTAEESPIEFIDFTRREDTDDFEQWCLSYLESHANRLASDKREKEMKARIIHAMTISHPALIRYMVAHTGRVSAHVKLSSNGALRLTVKENITNDDSGVDSNQHI